MKSFNPKKKERELQQNEVISRILMTLLLSEFAYKYALNKCKCECAPKTVRKFEWNTFLVVVGTPTSQSN